MFCKIISVRVFSIWGFTLFEMGGKFPMGGSEGGRVYVGGWFFAGGFCVESFTLYGMG